jgi:hypothetical protein
MMILIEKYLLDLKIYLTVLIDKYLFWYDKMHWMLSTIGVIIFFFGYSPNSFFLFKKKIIRTKNKKSKKIIAVRRGG